MKHPPTAPGGGSHAPEKWCWLSAGRAGKDSAQRETPGIPFTFNTSCIHRHTLCAAYPVPVCITHPHSAGTSCWTSSNIPGCNIPSPAAARPGAPVALKGPQESDTTHSASQHWLSQSPKGRGPSWRRSRHEHHIHPLTQHPPVCDTLRGLLCCGETVRTRAAGCGSATSCAPCQGVMSELDSSAVFRLCFTFSGPANKTSFQHAQGSIYKTKQSQSSLLYSNKCQAWPQGGEKLLGSTRYHLPSLLGEKQTLCAPLLRVLSL